MPEIAEQSAAPIADDPVDALQQRVLASISRRHALAPAYTTDDLAKIEPCPTCGVRARIENGRLHRPCIRAKHFPRPVPETAELKVVPPAVQRSFDDAHENWYR